MASKMTARLPRHGNPTLQTLIETAFQLLLSRPATEEEIAESLRFFNELSQLDQPPDRQTQLARFIHTLLNHNDFITIR